LTDLELNGRRVPIRTSTFQRTGDTHTKRNAGYIAGGAAVGAILGQVLGRDTQSTLEGAAAGAAAGTGAAAATGDLDFEVEEGRPVAFTLEEPLSL
jgi:outer membrane lipoprotein SlyB